MEKIVTPLSFFKVDGKLEGKFPIPLTEPLHEEMLGGKCYEEIVVWPAGDSKDTVARRTDLKTRDSVVVTGREARGKAFSTVAGIQGRDAFSPANRSHRSKSRSDGGRSLSTFARRCSGFCFFYDQFYGGWTYIGIDANHFPLIPGVFLHLNDDDTLIQNRPNLTGVVDQDLLRLPHDRQGFGEWKMDAFEALG